MLQQQQQQQSQQQQRLMANTAHMLANTCYNHGAAAPTSFGATGAVSNGSSVAWTNGTTAHVVNQMAIGNSALNLFQRQFQQQQQQQQQQNGSTRSGYVYRFLLWSKNGRKMRLKNQYQGK